MRPSGWNDPADFMVFERLGQQIESAIAQDFRPHAFVGGPRHHYHWKRVSERTQSVQQIAPAAVGQIFLAEDDIADRLFQHG